MVRTFYVQKGKEEIMHKFKETNEKLGLNYSATLVELMEKFNKAMAEEVNVTDNAKKVKERSVEL